MVGPLSCSLAHSRTPHSRRGQRHSERRHSIWNKPCLPGPRPPTPLAAGNMRQQLRGQGQGVHVRLLRHLVQASNRRAQLAMLAMAVASQQQQQQGPSRCQILHPHQGCQNRPGALPTLPGLGASQQGLAARWLLTHKLWRLSQHAWASRTRIQLQAAQQVDQPQWNSRGPAWPSLVGW